MFSYEQRMKAVVELYIQYNHRATAVIRELGYPGNPGVIAFWFKEFEKHGYLRKGYVRKDKYTDAQKQAAIQYYVDHGRCASQTIKDLGYPSPYIFRMWLDEAFPDRKKRCVSK